MLTWVIIHIKVLLPFYLLYIQVYIYKPRFTGRCIGREAWLVIKMYNILNFIHLFVYVYVYVHMHTLLHVCVEPRGWQLGVSSLQSWRVLGVELQCVHVWSSQRTKFMSWVPGIELQLFSFANSSIFLAQHWILNDLHFMVFNFPKYPGVLHQNLSITTCRVQKEWILQLCRGCKEENKWRQLAKPPRITHLSNFRKS